MGINNATVRKKDRLKERTFLNMKNIVLKKITSLLLVFILFVLFFSLPVQASGGPMKSKYYNSVDTFAGVSTSGVLTITNTYVVTGPGFSDAEMHTYVERRVLGFLWIKVNNGQTNNTWIDTSTKLIYEKNHYLTLPQTGTYRVTAEYTFNGSNGSESVTKQQTVTY